MQAWPFQDEWLEDVQWLMKCAATQHDLWSRTRDLASQSLFPLSLISVLVSMGNEQISSCIRSLTSSGWRGSSSSCNRFWAPLQSLELCSKRMIEIQPKILDSPWFSQAICWALKHCLIAQVRMYSGTSNVQTKSARQCLANDINGFHTIFQYNCLPFSPLDTGYWGGQQPMCMRRPW